MVCKCGHARYFHEMSGERGKHGTCLGAVFFKVISLPGAYHKRFCTCERYRRGALRAGLTREIVVTIATIEKEEEV